LILWQYSAEGFPSAPRLLQCVGGGRAGAGQMSIADVFKLGLFRTPPELVDSYVAHHFTAPDVFAGCIADANHTTALVCESLQTAEKTASILPGRR
jgi:hypothetical protein